MDLTDRLSWLIFGCLIGFVLGYIARYLQEIKQELDEVDQIVKQDRKRDERGIMRYPILADIVLLLVVIMTVWAAFASQKASNEVEDAQDRISRITACNQEYLAKTIKALNERTTYTRQQVEANVKLQRAQATFIAVILEDPPASDSRRGEALRHYFKALTDFVSVNSKADAKAENYPYPTNDELSSCIVN